MTALDRLHTHLAEQDYEAECVCGGCTVCLIRAAIVEAYGNAADIADQTATDMRENDGTWPEEWSSRDVRDAVQAAAAKIRTRAAQMQEPSK
ncbi:hypothetical protein E4K10_18120 [Streptomyces sp. T1317-0309]|nr:hypothetical protein E4K10_18120 [Streptomyces sp. T1317-0309]